MTVTMTPMEILSEMRADCSRDAQVQRWADALERAMQQPSAFAIDYGGGKPPVAHWWKGVLSPESCTGAVIPLYEFPPIQPNAAVSTNEMNALRQKDAEIEQLNECVRDREEYSASLSKSLRDQEALASYWLNKLNEADAKLADAHVEIGHLREALTPSEDTKAAYMGEFTMPFPILDKEGKEWVLSLNVPWITIKAIMNAISARARKEVKP